MSVQSLPPIPGTPFRALDYTANQGLWEGGLHEVRWGYPKGWLRSQVRRALLRRRAFQVVVSTPTLTAVATLRDEGTSGAAHVVCWSATGQTLVSARATGRPLGDLSVGPFSAEGTDAWLRTDGLELVLSRPPGASAWCVAARGPDLELDAELDTVGAPPPVTAIGEPARRRPGLASRWNLLPLRGSLRVGDQRVELADSLGSLAYTNAFQTDRARWFELSAFGRLPDGRRIGLGLSDGERLGDVHEHVLFVDGPWGPALHLLPRARVIVGGVVARDTWRIRSANGDLELKFRPLGGDVEPVRRPLGSRAVERVLGTFSGRVPLPDGTEAIVDGLPGLAEDHRGSR